MYIYYYIINLFSYNFSCEDILLDLIRTKEKKDYLSSIKLLEKCTFDYI